MIERFFLHSSANRSPLRIGLMLDGFQLTLWQRSILDQVLASSFCDLCYLVIHETQKKEEQPKGLIGRLWHYARDKRARSQFLYWQYLKLDQRFYGRRLTPNPLEPTDCTDLLQDLPNIRVTPIVKGFTHRFKPEDIAVILEQELDIIIRWGFNIIRGNALNTATHGVWSYHHGDNDFYRGGPPGYWELAERTPTTGVMLQTLNEELDAGLVLVKGHTSTEQGLSVTMNRHEQYWTGASFVIQKLHELHQYGPDILKERAIKNDFRGRRRLYRAPGNADVAQFVGRELWKKVVRRIGPRKPIYHWRTAIRVSNRRIDPFSRRPDLSQFRWINSPVGTFWADPFVIEHQGTIWLLFEDYRYGQARGALSAAPVGEDGTLGEAKPIMENDYHLSFPFVFKDGGATYMIPESRENETVDLYRAIDFPFSWTKVATLLQDFPALDTVMWKQDDLYWFFLSDPHYRLMLFYADSLTGEWTLHPSSPLSHDVRNARNAGAFFVDDGRLVRASQDCAGNYGRALNFHQITSLTPTEFEMKQLSTIEGTDFAESFPGLIGVHSYNRCGSVEVIDGARLENDSYRGF